MNQSGHKHGAVHIGGNDVRRFRKIGGAAYDIVASRKYGRDKGHTVGARIAGVDTVAHGHRIGGAQTFDSEIALYFTGQFGA